jgi:hypothetical protein
MENVRYQESPVLSMNKHDPFKGPSIVTGGRLKERSEKMYTALFTAWSGEEEDKCQALFKRALVRECHFRRMRLS